MFIKGLNSRVNQRGDALTAAAWSCWCSDESRAELRPLNISSFSFFLFFLSLLSLSFINLLSWFILFSLFVDFMMRRTWRHIWIGTWWMKHQLRRFNAFFNLMRRKKREAARARVSSVPPRKPAKNLQLLHLKL